MATQSTPSIPSTPSVPSEGKLFPKELYNQIVGLANHGLGLAEIAKIIEWKEEDLGKVIRTDGFFRKLFEEDERGRIQRKVDRLEEEKDLEEAWWHVERFAVSRVLREVQQDYCDMDYALKVAEKGRSINEKLGFGRRSLIGGNAKDRDGGYVNNVVRIEINSNYGDRNNDSDKNLGHKSVEGMIIDGFAKELIEDQSQSDKDRKNNSTILNDFVGSSKQYNSLTVSGVKNLLMSDHEKDLFEDMEELEDIGDLSAAQPNWSKNEKGAHRDNSGDSSVYEWSDAEEEMEREMEQLVARQEEEEKAKKEI